MAATITNTELAEWVETARTNAHSPGGARLEVVRLLREQSYVAMRFSRIGRSVEVEAAAEAILDTPVDKLAAMVVMSDTVMGNWRTIAATVSPVVY